jgi:sugar phosphate isomerase/epimerase
VADIGYIAVETAGFPGTTREDAIRLFQELGLQPCGAHIPLPLGDQQAEVLETMRQLGTPNLVKAYIPREEFATIEQIRTNCEMLNEANKVARANGLRLIYHNHDFEYETLDGRVKADIMRDFLDDDVLFELDTYWIETAGQDAVAVIQQLGTRAPLIHIKDGPKQRGEPMSALGTGAMDIPAIVAAADAAEWLIVELDRVAEGVDMMQAVEQSYDYLVGKGLARGNR